MYIQSRSVFNTSCSHYIIQPMRGPIQSFDDISKICMQCHRRLTDDEADAVRKKIEHLRTIAKW